MFLARFLTNVADFIVARSSDVVVVVVCAVEVVKWRESLRSFVRSFGRSSPEAKVLTYFTTRLAVAAVCPSIPGRCPPTRPEAAIARWRGKFQVGSSQKSKCSIVFRVAMRLKLCLSPVHPMSSVDRTLDAPKNAIVEGKFGTLN